MAKRIQYKSNVIVPPASSTNSWLEVVHPDVISQQQQLPQSNWKQIAMYSVAALMPFLAYTAVPTSKPFEWNTPQSQPIAKVASINYLTPVSQAKPVLPIVPVEVVTIDKWLQSPNQPTYRTPAQLEPAMKVEPIKPIPPPVLINIDTWHPSSLQPLGKVTNLSHLYSLTSFNPLPIPHPEVITMDKWFNATNQPILSQKRLQYTYPSTWLSPKPIVVIPVVTMDTWNTNTNIPVLDTKHLSYLYPNFFFYTKPIPTVVSSIVPRLALLGVGG